MTGIEKESTYSINEFDFRDGVHVNNALELLRTVFLNTKFTPEWWDWKYNRNPFGTPLGWYSVNNNKMVGVRLMTPNRFRLNDDVFTAYQLVDTATHPDHGRRGIFSALTKKAIEKIESENSFFFNFPNENSLPGYISLGWKEIIDLNWFVSITSHSSFFRRYKESEFSIPFISQKKFLHNVCTDWNEVSLNWRFKEHPYHKYYSFKLSEKEFIVYKIRKIKGFKSAIIMLGQSADYTSLCENFLKNIAGNGIPFVMYNGLNNGFIDFFLSRNIVLRSSSKMHYTTRNLPQLLDGKLLLELADTDYH